MTSTDIAPAALPQTNTNKAFSVTKDGKRLEVRGKLKEALDLMVIEGKWWNEAATEVGYTRSAMLKAMQRPHVLQYLKAQKQVFRAAVSSQNIQRLADIRDNSGNAMAQLGAIRLLEGDDEQNARAAASARTPGIVVQIINQGASEAKPVTTIDVVSAGRDDLSPDTSST